MVLVVSLAAFFLTESVFCQEFNTKLQEYSNSVTEEFSEIPKERQKSLNSISNYAFKLWANNKKIQPLFVCTHNSRRSQMSLIWFQAASYYYGINEVEAFSGGTETTAFNIRAVKALERTGFKYSVSNEESKNPVYNFYMGKRYPVVESFSKVYESKTNPTENFFAIMVCSDADKSCPIVYGADKRFSLPYNDPRYSDNTASEEKTYNERCRDIAREMFYILSKVKKRIVLYQENNK